MLNPLTIFVSLQFPLVATCVTVIRGISSWTTRHAVWTSTSARLPTAAVPSCVWTLEEATNASAVMDTMLLTPSTSSPFFFDIYTRKCLYCVRIIAVPKYLFVWLSIGLTSFLLFCPFALPFSLLLFSLLLFSLLLFSLLPFSLLLFSLLLFSLLFFSLLLFSLLFFSSSLLSSSLLSSSLLSSSLLSSSLLSFSLLFSSFLPSFLLSSSLLSSLLLFSLLLFSLLLFSLLLFSRLLFSHLLFSLLPFVLLLFSLLLFTLLLFSSLLFSPLLFSPPSHLFSFIFYLHFYFLLLCSLLDSMKFFSS